MMALEYLRKLNNLTMKELGCLIGVSKQSIDIWEKGKMKIPISRLKQFSDIFKVDIKYIDKVLTNEEMEYLLQIYTSRLS